MTGDTPRDRHLVRRSEIAHQLRCPAGRRRQVLDGLTGGQCGLRSRICDSEALQSLASESDLAFRELTGALVMQRSVRHLRRVGPLWGKTPANAAEALACVKLRKFLPGSVGRIDPLTYCPKLLRFTFAVVLVRNCVLLREPDVTEPEVGLAVGRPYIHHHADIAVS